MRRSIPVPDSISESSSGGDTILVCQWERNPITLGMFAFFWLIFLGFTIYWFHEMLGDESFVDWIQAPDWLPKLVLSSPILIAFGGGYGLLATYLNHTDVRVTSVDLETRVRPVPCRGNRTVPISVIKQLFVRENVNKDSYGRITKSYELHWVNSLGQRRPLIGRLRNHEALYLERRLEELLGIDDQFVSGSFRG